MPYDLSNNVYFIFLNLVHREHILIGVLVAFSLNGAWNIFHGLSTYYLSVVAWKKGLGTWDYRRNVAKNSFVCYPAVNHL
jgi:hypothetical protein